MTTSEQFSQGLPVRINTQVDGYIADMAPLAGGGWVVTWEGLDSDDLGIYAQIFNSAGNAVGGNFLVNDIQAGPQADAYVAALQDGGFVVAWEGNDVSTSDAYGRVFGADGTPLGGSFIVNRATAPEHQVADSIFAWNSGFGVIFKQDDDPSAHTADNLYEVIFDSSGQTDQVTDFRVNGFTNGDEYLSRATQLVSGGYAVNYTAYNYHPTPDTSANSVITRFFAADGSPVGEYTERDPGTGHDLGGGIAALAGGGVVVVYWAYINDSRGTDIFAQILTDQGEAVTHVFRANQHTAGAQGSPTVAALDDGGFVIVYASQNGATIDVLASIFNADGSVRVPEYTLSLGGPLFGAYYSNDVNVEGLKDGNWAITYTTKDTDGYPRDVYMQVFSPDTGGPPTLGSGFGKEVDGDAADNALAGADHADLLKGFGGNDTLDGGGSGDSLYGGAGSDVASYASASAGVLADLAHPANNTGDALGDSYKSIENLQGSAHADELRGTGGANRIDGGGGNDTLSGRGGDDTLEGEAGRDHLNGGSGSDQLAGNGGDDTLKGGGGGDHLDGGSGHDRLLGNAGDDVLAGGASGDSLMGGTGTDVASYASASAGLLADLLSPGNNTGDAAGDSYNSIEDLLGSAHGDELRGNGVANRIDGGGGNDTLLGRGGSDTLQGGTGSDHLNGGGGSDKLDGGGGRDGLAGNGGNDILAGGSGADTLSGGNGADTLRGQTGKDVLTGGGGHDTFDFDGIGDSASGKQRDHITDFNKAGDVIDLHNINARTGVAGDQGFDFIGALAFSDTKGELRAINAGANTKVLGDVNGDGKVDFSILVEGVHGLDAGDFIL